VENKENEHPIFHEVHRR